MSLLMDALKQAEHAKRTDKQDKHTPSTPTAAASAPAARSASPDTAPLAAPLQDKDETPTAADASPELSLSPVEPGEPDNVAAATHFDEISAPDEQAPPAEIPTIDTVTADAAAEAPSSETVSPVQTEVEPELTLARPEPERDATHQHAARILAASQARIRAHKRRLRYGLIGLGLLLMTAVIGYHYWTAANRFDPQVFVPELPEAGVEAVAPHEAVAAESTPPEKTAWREGQPPAQSQDDWERAPVDSQVLKGEQPEPEAPVAEVTASPSAMAAIRISRGTRSDRISDSLQTAYLDYRAGRYAQAQDGYRAVLAVEPNNRDAKLGLAALAMQRGDSTTADAIYRELLRLDPKDSSAQAGLASLQTQPTADTESELKLLLAEQPQAAHLYFALANLYAAQARWPLAQQAYFDAVRLAPAQADYAFNLAVSLEHLGQPGSALQFYRRALSLAAEQGANFDRSAAAQRVQVLEGMTGP